MPCGTDNVSEAIQPPLLLTILVVDISVFNFIL